MMIPIWFILTMSLVFGYLAGVVLVAREVMEP